jgi:hypothetical protein
MILSVHKQPNPMTFSETLLEFADDNGQIRWIDAAYAAKQHGFFEDFKTEYGTTASFGGVDAGEFLVWMGY